MRRYFIACLLCLGTATAALCQQHQVQSTANGIGGTPAAAPAARQDAPASVQSASPALGQPAREAAPAPMQPASQVARQAAAPALPSQLRSKAEEEEAKDAK